jgi:DtxR family Mn-dependent transcriptional regulator
LEKKLTPNMEDYLEVIYQLCQKDGLARVKDISAHLDVTNPSVVGALKNLKRKKLVQQQRYGYIRLTNSGQKLAAAVQDRHEAVCNFLENILGLDRETASRDACKIEHAVSQETVRRLQAVADYLLCESCKEFDWLEAFTRYYHETITAT